MLRRINSVRTKDQPPSHSVSAPVLDDFSRYIIAWKLCPTMKAEDVTATLNLALKASGLDQAKVIHRPRLLSDNGSSYISADLAKWLDGQNMEHVRGAPHDRAHQYIRI